MANIKIAIDAGHGSKTKGKRTPLFKKNVDIDKNGSIDIKKGSSYLEHYGNVGVANQIYKELVLRGYDVIKSGWDDANAKDDPDTSLSARQKKIKKAKCDYSISIHFNAYGDGKNFNSAKGLGIYIHSKYAGDSKRFAKYLLHDLSKNTPQTIRGIKKAKLAMCNCKSLGTKASVLCEIAFMTNEHEAMDLMANMNFWKENAKEIANALDRYCDAVKKDKKK